MTRHPNFPRLVLAICLLLGWLNESVHAGSGDEFHPKSQDILLYVDSRWAGTGYGGYYPIRIQVTNKGPACVLTLRFRPYANKPLPIVERRNLAINSEGKTTITLSIPMVGRGNLGDLEVEKDGEIIPGLTTQIGLPQPENDHIHPSILIIAPPPRVDATWMRRRRRSPTTGPRSDFHIDYQYLEPLLLPNAWSDYTGLDMVIIPLRTLAELESDKRAAIIKWVQTGGTLMVYEVGASAKSSTELHALFNLPESTKWKLADPTQMSRRDRSETEPVEPVEGIPWDRSTETFASTQLIFGHLYAFPQNPFPGTAEDWEWWMNSLPASSRVWESRYGVLPRRNNEDFFNFLIPGVTSVPVYAFLVLMTLFTIGIGPLNYLLLRRRKRTYLMLLTIPVIAFLTSLTLFVYSTLSYGFHVSSRCRSLTILDQRTNTAVSLSRISLFAGMAPSDGLSFSPDTAVFPIWPATQYGQSQFETGRTVWGERQELEDGWLQSRTRTQFATVQHRTERGRLEIEVASESELTISNGLEWDLEGLIWVDEQDRVYLGETLPAGHSGSLTRVYESDLVKLGQIVRLLNRHPLEFPDDLANNAEYIAERSRRGSRFERFGEEDFTKGFLETNIHEFQELQTNASLSKVVEVLSRRSYLAILAENPDIELGLEDTEERAGYHLILGRY